MYLQTSTGLNHRDSGLVQREKSKPLDFSRFLILQWVQVKNLASHLIALSIKHLKHDWPLLYKIEPYLLETFVDRDLYKELAIGLQTGTMSEKLAVMEKLESPITIMETKKECFYTHLRKTSKS